MPKPAIVTGYVHPPIPMRDCDWCAHYQGEEEEGHYGWGRTEAEAIDDFIVNQAEDHDQAARHRRLIVQGWTVQSLTVQW